MPNLPPPVPGGNRGRRGIGARAKQWRLSYNRPVRAAFFLTVGRRRPFFSCAIWHSFVFRARGAISRRRSALRAAKPIARNVNAIYAIYRTRPDRPIIICPARPNTMVVWLLHRKLRVRPFEPLDLAAPAQNPPGVAAGALGSAHERPVRYETQAVGRGAE